MKEHHGKSDNTMGWYWMAFTCPVWAAEPLQDAGQGLRAGGTLIHPKPFLGTERGHEVGAVLTVHECL